MKKAPTIINANIDAMRYGMHVRCAGNEYWINAVADPDLVLWISYDRAIAGAINGREYARVTDGVAYRV